MCLKYCQTTQPNCTICHLSGSEYCYQTLYLEMKEMPNDLMLTNITSYTLYSQTNLAGTDLSPIELQTGILSINITRMLLGVDYLIIAYFSSNYQIQLSILFLTTTFDTNITFDIMNRL